MEPNWTNFWYDMAVAAGTVIAGGTVIILGPRGWKGLLEWHRRRSVTHDTKVAAARRTNELLNDILTIVKEYGADVRCLYEAQEPQLEALEVVLMLMRQEHVNGEGERVLSGVREAKATIRKRMTEKVGCADVSAVGLGVD